MLKLSLRILYFIIRFHSLRLPIYDKLESKRKKIKYAESEKKFALKPIINAC